MSEEDKLISIATSVRANSYAPYSKFQVGAALLATNGQIFSGTNVESISLGLTMCAERVAIGAAISAGSRRWSLLAISSDSKEPVVPCGACRQVLAEFDPVLRIVSSTTDGKVAEFRLEELLPIPRQGILG